MNTLYASFDCEVVPRHYRSFDGSTWGRYESSLVSLGTKSDPQRFMEENVQMHPDGLATEYAPIIPFGSSEDFLAAVDYMHNLAESMVNMPLMGVDWLDLADVPDFTADTAPELWELSHTLGCSQDFDPHGARHVPQLVKDSTIKEVGFHIHIDVHPKFIGDHESVLSVVGDFHAAVGFLLPRWTATRPPWYRKPMTYRPKPYGLEYRSFGASIIEDKGKLALLALITYDFMRDHFNTHDKEYHP